ncbi:glycoside hydrolase family 43 protein [Massilia oculi]|uniref:Glycoside hydrolase family 43 protein n=1 Tax=Massilia hydrophila TaxID=3044279 RepID=A0ABS7Y7K6_9BURK|nr:glycoside hydrolase family 43 protein [Massilia oculi]MCA1855656.1 glycoside hydrolase family 43 protein [Massilia oculi]
MLNTYCNPVYPEIMADPFVLRHEGRYYAYGTAPAGPGGGRFPVLVSNDLVDWHRAGYAMAAPGADEFWAPEVAHADGRFWLYYSRGDSQGHGHRLRVAVADHPAGPFSDCDTLLVPDQPFSIDAHPFRDHDGQWYLYYCVDFLELEDEHRIGTGIVVDRMLAMDRLAGQPRTVARPHADWQLFKKGRAMYDAVYDWHTVEGASVLVHGGRYYCFYSGGAWEQENYGVSWVVAEHPLGPFTRPEGSEHALLMRTRPGNVIGPGHNSFTTSPDGSQDWIVYHAWDPAMTGRRMCIDRLTWDGGRPSTAGPSFTRQPAPAGLLF